MATIPYRKDIDALRAIAVMLVIAFHLGIKHFTGGYIGVDIFFVISGFLITTIIKHEIQTTGSFDFTHFFARRFRRLFPAYLFMLILVSIVSFLVLHKEEITTFTQSALYSLLYSSNIFFWMNSGYFDAGAENNPILHTWSLGVEEQFYFLWPLILYQIYKFKNRNTLAFIIICIIGVVSLLLNYLYFIINPETIAASVSYKAADFLADVGKNTYFYLTPFRVFEFAIGAVLAQEPPRFNNRIDNFVARLLYLLNKPITINFLSILGMGLIVYSVFTFDQNTLFPFHNALLPCTGAALLILTKQNSIVAKMISNKILIQIGLMSYSLYLIHWPTIIFYKNIKRTRIHGTDIIAILSIMFILSYISYQYVEKRFRRAKFKRSRSKDIKFMRYSILTTIILFILFASSNLLDVEIFQKQKSYPHNFNVWMRKLSCHAKPSNNHCLEIRNRNTTKKAIFLIGDSHALNFMPPIRAITREYYFRYESSNWNKMHVLYKKEGWKSYDSYLKSHATKGDIIIFSIAKRRFWKDDKTFFIGNDITDNHRFHDIVSIKKTDLINFEKVSIFNENMIHLANSLSASESKFYFIKDLPTWMTRKKLMDCVTKKVNKEACEADYSKVNIYDPLIYGGLKNQKNIEFLNFDSILCPKNKCSLFQNGRFVTWDTDPHLTHEFSMDQHEFIYNEIFKDIKN